MDLKSSPQGADASRSSSYQQKQLPQRRWKEGLMLLGAAASYYLYTGLHNTFNVSTTISTKPKSQNSDKKSWDWAVVSASRDLEWHSCYGGDFDCARLDVPLDWLDPSEEERVVIAVVRLEAKNKTDYRGPVFVNPGGPGGSGVSYLVDDGEKLQTIIGDNHDVISFDPRGIGASVPRIECWSSSQQRHDWDALDIKVMDTYPGIVYEAYVQAQAYSKQCETHMEKSTPELLKHLSTASHARDMLEITEKAGFPKLKYWGFSYGTILGGTFAALFPDRVERLVSDGNVDYNDWYSLERAKFLEDTDKIMEAFFESCFKAGPEKCSFYVAENAEAIKTRFLNLLDSLRKSPVLVEAKANGTFPLLPELITYSKLQLLIRTVIYKPIHKAVDLAKVLSALEQKDGLPFYRMDNENSKPPTMDFCSSEDTLPTVPTDSSTGGDAFPAIMCADGEQFSDTVEEFIEFVDELKEMSQFAGSSNAHFRLICAGRTIRPKWRHTATAQGGNTSFPILFIGNIADNVTPLINARNNAKRFPGSVVLVQKSYGHCTLAAPSTCSAKVINAYFQDGELPTNGMECEQDYDMFEDPPEVVVSGEDGNIALAVQELSRESKLFYMG